MRIIGIHKRLTHALNVGFGKKLAATGEQFGRGNDFGYFFYGRKEREIGFLTDNVVSAGIQVSGIVVVFVGLTCMRMLGANDAGERCYRGCLRGGKQHRTYSGK